MNYIYYNVIFWRKVATELKLHLKLCHANVFPPHSDA